MPIDPGIEQCSYVRPDGRRCGSPARGRDDRCSHHDRERYPEPLVATPQLREIADVLADPNFHGYVDQIRELARSGQVTTNDLFNLLHALLGYDLREPEESLPHEYSLRNQRHMSQP